MRVGKQDHPFTAICTSDVHSINIRGRDLCGDLMGKVGFTEFFFFLVAGKMPSEDQNALLNAVLLSIAEHGLVAPNQAARMTFSAAPEAMQGAVAAGLLSCGSVVLGTAETCARFLASIVARADAEKISDIDAAKPILQEYRASRRAVPGYGHPQHKEGDPRAIKLLQLAKDRKTAGRYVALLEGILKILPEVYGRELPINVSGAIPAVIVDAGFPLGAVKGIPLLARTASLIAHVYEESTRPIGFIMSGHGADAITYDGPALQAGAHE